MISQHSAIATSLLVAALLCPPGALTQGPQFKANKATAAALKQQRACESGIQRLVRDRVPRGLGASKAQIDQWVSVEGDCANAANAAPETPWVLHDYAMFMLAAGGGGSTNDIHREGISRMATAVKKAEAVNDVFTVDAGCRLLNVFHLAGDAQCNVAFAEHAHATAIETVNRLLAENAAAEKLNEEQRQQFEAYRRLQEQWR